MSKNENEYTKNAIARCQPEGYKPPLSNREANRISWVARLAAKFSVDDIAEMVGCSAQRVEEILTELNYSAGKLPANANRRGRPKKGTPKRGYRAPKPK